jgi:uncharacterized protein with NRDE domain
MCTVTYVPTSKGFCFTSSRDEKTSRSTIPPTKYRHGEIDLFYPKDEVAGGTWFATSVTGRSACLLNGAFVNHQKSNFYAKSRGVILLELYKFKKIQYFVDAVELGGVEPFTLLLLEHPKGELEEFFELRWDGKTKHFREVSTVENQIWSSPTLYSFDIQKRRNKLFKSWVTKNKQVEDKRIMSFHQQRHGLNEAEDILMKRIGSLQTVSVSQLQLCGDGVFFNYHDVLTNTAQSIHLQLNN